MLRLIGELEQERKNLETAYMQFNDATGYDVDIAIFKILMLESTIEKLVNEAKKEPLQTAPISKTLVQKFISNFTTKKEALANE